MSARDERSEHPPEGVARRRSGTTLRDVAAHAGVSTATVSLVLNRASGSESISAKTHERVLASARELAYRPNLLARSLRSRRTSSIGVLVPEISEGYATGVLGGVEDHLLEESFFYLLASHHFKENLIVENMEMLKDRLVEGLILVNTRVREAPGLPTVSISGDREIPGVVSVIVDHDLAARLALAHLAELGHRKIAVMKGHPLSADSAVRWSAIEKAAAELGLAMSQDLSPDLDEAALASETAPEMHYREGYDYGKGLLAASGDFSAFFAFNDISAIGAMKAFSDAGFRVPEDISVIGFDDIEAAAFHNPGLTTVRQPLHEMGATASRMLLEWLAGATPEARIVTVEPDLVVRDSTAPAPRRAASQA